jgi:hypothetical protein
LVAHELTEQDFSAVLREGLERINSLLSAEANNRGELAN